MKLLSALVILVILQSCSFDNKTGIWKKENNISTKDDNLFSEFETLLSSEKVFDQIINLDYNSKFQLSEQVDNYNWKDILFSGSNNFKNFKYNNLNKVIFKSKKLTNNQISNFLLFEENNLIINDQKGNIIIFSINENKVISKFNFYKKKYKKIKKLLNLIVDKNIIYVSDNIGFLYAFDYKNKNILWAKNYNVPFRSNLKLHKDQIIAASQNNNLIFFNKKNGEIIKSIPTEETIIKNAFTNNLSIENENLFFLNTYGSLYSINSRTMRINWFVNLNENLDLNLSNIFFGSKIINNKDLIVSSANEYTYVVDINTGSIIHKKSFFSEIKPVIMNNYLFTVSKNNLLISMDLISGKILYSYDINQKISEFLDIKKKFVEFKEIMIVNDKIFIFLKNSYLLIFNIRGSIEDVIKLPTKIKSQPIFIDNSLLYLDFKNKLCN